MIPHRKPSHAGTCIICAHKAIKAINADLRAIEDAAAAGQKPPSSLAKIAAAHALSTSTLHRHKQICLGFTVTRPAIIRSKPPTPKDGIGAAETVETTRSTAIPRDEAHPMGHPTASHGTSHEIGGMASSSDPTPKNQQSEALPSGGTVQARKKSSPLIHRNGIVGDDPATSPTKVSAAQVAAQAADLRAKGWTYRRMSEHLGVSPETLKDLVERFIIRLNKGTVRRVAAIAGIEMDRVDRMVEVAMERVFDPPTLADKEGVDTGVVDLAAQDRAIDRFLKLQERWLRLNGIDVSDPKVQVQIGGDQNPFHHPKFFELMAVFRDALAPYPGAWQACMAGARELLRHGGAPRGGQPPVLVEAQVVEHEEDGGQDGDE